MDISTIYQISNEDYELSRQIGNELKRRPDILQDAHRIVPLLADILQDRHLEVNVLRILLNEGLSRSAVNTRESNGAILSRFAIILQSKYGIPDAVSKRLIAIWLHAHRGIVLGMNIPYRADLKETINDDSCAILNRNIISDESRPTLGKSGNTDYEKKEIQQRELASLSAARAKIAIMRGRISSGNNADHLLAIKDDGTVLACGTNIGGECEVSRWKNIIQVSSTAFQSFGLQSTGRVCQVGRFTDNNYSHYKGAAEWNNIRLISACSAMSAEIAGITRDGQILFNSTFTGYLEDFFSQNDFSEWADVVEIGSSHTTDVIVGLKSNGKVVCASKDYRRNKQYRQIVSKWENIVSIAVDFGGDIYALTMNGKVLCTEFYNLQPQKNTIYNTIRRWDKVVAITAGLIHVIGLKGDGSVVAAGEDMYGECNVFNWKDIVAVVAGARFTAGVKSNGTVVVTGDNTDGVYNASSWKLFDSLEQLNEKLG